MPKIGRLGLSREKRAELGKRWKNGHCASDIARALERTKGAIHHVLAFNGGNAPAARRRGPARSRRGHCAWGGFTKHWRLPCSVSSPS